MKRPITFLCVLLVLISCSCNGYSQAKNHVKSFKDIQEEVVNVLFDSTTTAKQLKCVMAQYGDYLMAAATDPDDINMRLDAQRRSLFTIQLLFEKFAQMDSLGTAISSRQMGACLLPLLNASNQWGAAELESGPAIFHEFYYNSYQHSENSTPGYFQIIVYLPTKQCPEPAVSIFYPQTAESDPIIIFTEHKDEDDEYTPYSTFGSRKIVLPNALEMKNAKGDGTPMNDFFGPEFLKKMLKYDHMYLKFQSECRDSGSSGETEIARVDLSYFKKKYRKVSHQL